MNAPRVDVTPRLSIGLLHGPVLCFTVDRVQWFAVPLRRRDVVIGRDEACDLQLDDHSVSRFHARLTLGFGADRVEDLQSRNGTVFQGRRCGEFPLREGETFRLGSVLFLFSRSPATARLPDGRRVCYLPVQSLVQRPVSPGPDDETAVFASCTAVFRPGMLERLVRCDQLWAHGCLVSETDRQRWPLGLKAHRLGWRTEVPVPGWAFGGWTGAGHGAVISWQKDAHMIRSTALFATVWVNGREVSKRTLRHGDRILAGGRRFRYLAA